LPEKVTVVFFVLAFIAWLLTTSILRYAIVLETLSFIIIWIVVSHAPLPARAQIGLILVLCVFCVATAQRGDWGHRDFSEKTFDVDTSWIPDHTLFLGVYEPVAYLAALVPLERHAQFAGLGFLSYVKDWPLGQEGRELVHLHQGPIYVLFREDRRPFLKLLSEVGLSSDVQHCRPWPSNIIPLSDPTILACEAKPL
jgi:hypothetical protein